MPNTSPDEHETSHKNLYISFLETCGCECEVCVCGQKSAMDTVAARSSSKLSAPGNSQVYTSGEINESGDISNSGLQYKFN